MGDIRSDFWKWNWILPFIRYFFKSRMNSGDIRWTFWVWAKWDGRILESSPLPLVAWRLRISESQTIWDANPIAAARHALVTWWPVSDRIFILSFQATKPRLRSITSAMHQRTFPIYKKRRMLFMMIYSISGDDSWRWHYDSDVWSGC